MDFIYLQRESVFGFHIVKLFTCSHIHTLYIFTKELLIHLMELKSSFKLNPCHYSYIWYKFLRCLLSRRAPLTTHNRQPLAARRWAALHFPARFASPSGGDCRTTRGRRPSPCTDCRPADWSARWLASSCGWTPFRGRHAPTSRSRCASCVVCQSTRVWRTNGGRRWRMVCRGGCAWEMGRENCVVCYSNLVFVIFISIHI